MLRFQQANAAKLCNIPSACAAISLIILSLASAAYPGNLDYGFGSGGRFSINFFTAPPYGSGANGLYFRPNGSILAAGSNLGPGTVINTSGSAYVALNPNGTLDTSYFNIGYTFHAGGFTSTATLDRQTQPDGKVLLLQRSDTIKVGGSSNLSRLNPDWSFDSSFSADLRLPSGQSIGVIKMGVRPDGKILVLGAASGYILLRLNPNGSRDTSFGENGMKPIDLSRLPVFSVAGLSAPMLDGKFVIAGTLGNTLSNQTNFFAARFDADGNYDRAFGIQGIARFSPPATNTVTARKLLVQPDGKILIAGASSDVSEDSTIVRLTTRGKLDGNFGSGGFSRINFSPEGSDRINGMILAPGGKILTAGRKSFPGSSLSAFHIARYSETGILETEAASVFFRGRSCEAFDIGIHPNGRIVAVGNTLDAVFGQGFSRFAVAQYTSISSSEKTIRRTFDFDGDGLADPSHYRQDPTNQEQSFWEIRLSSNGVVNTFFGLNGDIPVPSDFNDDGKTDVAVFRPSNGTWYYTTNINDPNYQTVVFGQSGDNPVANDYDGDSRADFAVYRPSTGEWHIKQSIDGSVRATQMGAPGDMPVTGDFDGDSKADPAIWRPGIANFVIVRSSDGQLQSFQIGSSGSIPVPADYDGDFKTDVGVYDPATGRWQYRRSYNGNIATADWGASDDIPTPADFDGDGSADVAIFRPSLSQWWVVKSASNTASKFNFGQPGDIPLPGR